jgi:hypothetical protein
MASTGFKSYSGPDADAEEQPRTSSSAPKIETTPTTADTSGLEDAYNRPSATGADRPRPQGSNPALNAGNSTSPSGTGRRALSASDEAALKDTAVSTYRRAGDKKLASKSLSFASKHRKQLLGGGGIAGLIIALALGFAALLPLKIESIIKNLYGHEVGRAESYVDRRVQAILFRYIYENATGTLAADGFYTNGSIIKTIYGNLRVNQFEKKLLDEKGIKIEKTGARSIRVTLSDGTKFDAASDADLMQHMGVELKGKAARDAIKNMVDQTYHPLQFFKRAHMRKFLRNAYNISRFALKKQEETKDPKNPDLPGSTEQDIQSAQLDASEQADKDAVDCLLSSTCADDSQRRNPDGSSEAKPPVSAEDHNGDTAAAEGTAAEATKTEIGNAYSRLKTATNAAIEKGLTAIFGEAIAKGILKAVPIIGWIALAADLDNFFWSGKLGVVVVHLHDAQYAAAASTWMTIADQFKAGQFTGTQVNAIMLLLADVEKSSAVQRILFGNNQAGLKLTSAQRVGSDSSAAIADTGNGPCSILWFPNHVGDPPPSGLNAPDYWTYFYRQAENTPPNFVHSTLCAIRIPLDAFSSALSSVFGGVLGFIVNAAISALDAIASAVVGHSVDLLAAASSSLTWIINHVFTPVVTGREIGAALGNVIDAGLDVIGNQMCRDVLGCSNISYLAAYNEDLALANDDRDQLRQLSPIAALTNTDYPESFGSQMLAMMPATPSAAIGDLGSTSLAMISNPFHLFANTFLYLFPPAGAATPSVQEPNGVQQTGMSETALDDANLHLPTKDIAGPPGPDGKLTPPDGRIDQYDCPVITDPNVENPCLLDVTAAQDLCAGLTTNDDGGLGGHGTPGPCGDPSAPGSAAATADSTPTSGPDPLGAIAKTVGPYLLSIEQRITGRGNNR